MAEASTIRRKSIRDINEQVVRMVNSQQARGNGRISRILGIRDRYYSNIEGTPQYQRGTWQNGRYTGADIRFPRSVYMGRRNNR